jgi:ADP-ribosylglycohydrolase
LEIKKRAYGALLGVALGDALGMPSELWSRKKVKAYFGEITEFLPGPTGHLVADGMQAGEVTDDTIQTVKVAEALIADNGRVRPETIVTKLLELVTENNALETNMLGPSSKRALAAIKEGVPLTESGKMGTTNGAAMRIVPVGIISPIENLTELVDNVEQACLPTHNTNIAIAGAAAVAAAVSTALEGASLEEILNNAVKAMRIGDERGHDTFGASIIARTYWALRIVEESVLPEEAMEKLYNLIGAGVETTESVPTALALVKLASGDPYRAGLSAANLGGDCDTIGAIACGICGAFTGIDGIPTFCQEKLLNVNDFNFEELSAGLLGLRGCKQ